MTNNKAIDQQNFEKLLNWLDSDREIAGQKYEAIRLRLIKIFNSYGCFAPEELADKTIDRVTQKIDSVVNSFEGQPVMYFYGVGKKILLEDFRTPKAEELNPLITAKREKAEEDEDTETLRCLRICLQELTADQRDLILAYYQKDKREKINNRKFLAQKEGGTHELLRIHVYRIRTKLQKCIKKCLKKV